MFGLSKEEKLKKKLNVMQLEKQLDMLESLPDWAKDSDEDTWSSDPTEVYSESDLSSMRGKAWNLYYTNPMARRVVEAIIDFVVGKRCVIKAIDEPAQEYWDEFYKANDFDERSKELVRRTLVDGEQFLQFFFQNMPKIRSVNAQEIKSDKYSYGIETMPSDAETPVRYYREWVDENNMQHYETIPARNMVHNKIMVNKNTKRGVSFYTGIGKYFTDYQNWLQDRTNLNKLRSYFMVIGNVKGSSAASAVGAKMPNSTTKTDKKAKFKSGTVLSSKGVDWDLKSLNINAPDTKDDGRNLTLMIAAGSGLTEYVVSGDSSNANYSSTMVSESPMVKAFEGHQDYFEKVFKEIFRKVVDHGKWVGKIPERYETEEKNENGELVKVMKDVSSDCEVVFPVLIHRDPKEESEALQIQKINGWVSDETCSEKLGYDYEEEKKRIMESEEELKSKEVEEMLHHHEH